MEIHIKGDSKAELDRAVRKWSKMVKDSGLLQELRTREAYQKPSVKRKNKQKNALRTRKRAERKEQRHT